MATIFHGGLVFDGHEMLREQAVVIDQGTIINMDHVSKFNMADFDVVDTSNCTLMPGLIDAHIHLCFTPSADPSAILLKQTPGEVTMTALANAQTTLRGGVTSVRDCGGKNYLELAVRDGINRGQFIGPTIHASGKMICMTGGHGNRWARVADGCDEVVKAVREQVHCGCDMVKIMATGGVLTPGVEPEDAHYSADEMRVGVNEAKRFRKRTASHAQGTEGILNAVRAGIDSIEHGIFMDQQCIDEMLAAGTYLVPTLAALQNILLNAKNGIPSYMLEKVNRVSKRHTESFQDFYRQGGKIAMGTDAGTPFNLHGLNAQELQFMVDIGMAPIDALKAATVNGADLMGLADRGAIAINNVADFLLVKGDPSEDISLVADVKNHVSVFKDGVKF